MQCLVDGVPGAAEPFGNHVDRKFLERERQEHPLLVRGERSFDPVADGGTQRGVFRPKESWIDGVGQAFNPGNYYYVGGRTWYYPAGYNNPVQSRPGQGSYNLPPGSTSPGAVSRIGSSRSTSSSATGASSRGGFGSSSHSHGVSS